MSDRGAAGRTTERPTEPSAAETIAFAGPGLTLTLPGVIASEISASLSDFGRVTRINVDPSSNFTAGIHRAPSLSSSIERPVASRQLVAPRAAHERARFFHDVFTREYGTAVAYVWPGLDNQWLSQFVHAARGAAGRVVVACESVSGRPSSSLPRLAHTLRDVDVVVVGSLLDAEEARLAIGSSGPTVMWHDALALDNRGGTGDRVTITSFIPRDDETSLRTVLAAFDAIPESWIDRYALRIVTRADHSRVAALVSESYHGARVEVVGDAMTSEELTELCDDSSALSVAVPEASSRVMSAAIEQGIGIVVMRNGSLPAVGYGYVGGLLASRESASSVHVGLNHALRFTHLRFPQPSVWESLAKVLVDGGPLRSKKSRLEIVT